MASVPPALLALFTILEHYQVVKFTLMASTTLGVYDWAIRFADEVELIWNAPWSVVKCIFLCTRYSFFIIMPIIIYENSGPEFGTRLTTKFCKEWSITLPFWTAFLFAAMHWLVLVRVHAFWGRGRKMFIFLATLWVIGFLATVIEVIVAMAQSAHTIAVEPTLGICTMELPSWLAAVHCSFLIVEIPLLVLTIIKFKQDSKSSVNMVLLNKLIHDGVLYFFVVLFLTMWNMLFSLFAPPVLGGVPRFLSIAITNVCACNLILSLRGAIRRDNNTDTLQGSGQNTNSKIKSSSAGHHQRATSATYVYMQTVSKSRIEDSNGQVLDIDRNYDGPYNPGHNGAPDARYGAAYSYPAPPPPQSTWGRGPV